VAIATVGGIDCDVHPAVPSMAALLPHLDDLWRETIVLRGIDGLDLASYPPGAPANCRTDWRPPGGKGGTDLGYLQRQALDAFGTRFAIANVLYGAQALHSEDMAAALCRGVNYWLARDWLDPEPRLRASIVVPWQNPHLAAAEIHRVAPDPRFVSVLLLVMVDQPLGRRSQWPIYEAAAAHGLPVTVHAGSAGRHPVSGATGWGSYHVEDYVAQAAAFQSQLLSLLYEGVFERFPTLKVVFAESGVTWLPTLLWRARKTWRALRSEVPWVLRPPEEVVAEHVRFTTQPFDAPASAVERVLDQLGSDRLLLFSTDHPHHHFEGNDALPPGFPADLARRVLVDNPLDTFPRLAAAATTLPASHAPHGTGG
jgi:predicted TIM-barrel fold metal-dependent hydrolase